MPGPVTNTPSTTTNAALPAAPAPAVSLGVVTARGVHVDKLTLQAPALPAGARYELRVGAHKLAFTVDRERLTVDPAVKSTRRNSGGFYAAGTGDEQIVLHRLRVGERVDVRAVFADGSRSDVTSLIAQPPAPERPARTGMHGGTMGDLRHTRDGGLVVVRENGDWSRAPNDIERERREAERLSRAGYVDVYSYDSYGRTIIRTLNPGESHADAVRRGGNTRDAYSPSSGRRYPWDR